MKQMKITLETISPVIVTAQNNSTLMTATQEFFSGSILRGILAKRYIQAKHLDKDAHKDPAFRKLFFGQLKFVDAYFVKDGQRSFPLPQSLQMDKPGIKLLDLLTDAPKAGFKSVRGMGLVCDGILNFAKPLKVMQLHMSRSHTGERISGKSSAKTEGNIYNYEALTAGQKFTGYILGEEEELVALKEAVSDGNGSFTCHVGRSKYAQYGTCRMKIDEPEPAPQIAGDVALANKQGQHRIFIRLETPFIPETESGMLVSDSLQEIVTALNERCHTDKINIDADAVFASAQSLKNFVGIWGLKRPEETALAAGSVFALVKNEPWTENELAQLNQMLYEGVGRRTEEGFGQLRIWKSEKLSTLNSKNSKEAPVDLQPEAYALQTDEVKRIAARIMQDYIFEQVRNCAAEDAGSFRKAGINLLSDLEFSTHLFGELELLLKESEKNKKEKGFFQAVLAEELENRSEMKRNLERMKLYDLNMEEWLLSSASIPCPAGMELYQRFGQDAELGDLLSLLDRGLTENDELYFEYWRWFFQHARKQTRIKKEARG